MTIRYKCALCGKEFDSRELEMLPGVRCPYCGFRVIFKVRPPIVKKVKAI